MEKQTNNSPWMNQAECAEYMKVDRTTVHRWKREFGLPFHRVGGIVRYHRDEVDEWVRSHEEESSKGVKDE